MFFHLTQLNSAVPEVIFNDVLAIEEKKKTIHMVQSSLLVSE